MPESKQHAPPFDFSFHSVLAYFDLVSYASNAVADSQRSAFLLLLGFWSKNMLFPLLKLDFLSIFVNARAGVKKPHEAERREKSEKIKKFCSQLVLCITALTLGSLLSDEVLSFIIAWLNQALLSVNLSSVSSQLVKSVIGWQLFRILLKSAELLASKIRTLATSLKSNAK